MGILEDCFWRGENLIYKDNFDNIISTREPSDKIILVSNKTMNGFDINDYTISYDQKFALLGYNNPDSSSNPTYIIYSVTDGEVSSLGAPNSNGGIQAIDFGPRGSQILYIVNGDMYYKDNATAASARLTKSGEVHGILNGVTDWTYKNKLLKSTTAFWWSPSGTSLAYVTFDDRKVGDMITMSYNDAGSNPTLKVYKMPKPGYPNPVAKVKVVDLSTFIQVEIKRPVRNRMTLDTFQSLSWLSNDELLVTWSNRTSTASSTQKCFKNMTSCVDGVIEQLAPSKNNGEYRGWLRHLNQKLFPSNSNGRFYCVLPSKHGGKGSFQHIAQIDSNKKPTRLKFLTNGNWEVDEILFFDFESGNLFYTSNELYPASRHVYKINAGNSHVRTCVTCALQSGVTTHQMQVVSNVDKMVENKSYKYALYGDKPCFYFTASFGKNKKWFLLRCLGPALPYSVMSPLDKLLYPHNISSIYDEERMFQPPSSLVHEVTPLVRYETLVQEGRNIHVEIMTPDTYHLGKRPVVFFVGNVGEQNVDFKFKMDMATYIVATAKLIAVFVDGRGSGRYGNENIDAVKFKPGVLEIEDMKTVLRWLGTQQNVDTNNVALVGRGGYAGFTAILALTQNQNPFQCAAVISPITNWNIADSITAEKLLGSPNEDHLIYEESNLLVKMENMRGFKLKVLHGLEDEDVSVQHSILLENAIMRSSIPVGDVTFNYYKKLLHTDDNDKELYRFERSHMLRSVDLFLQGCLLADYASEEE